MKCPLYKVRMTSGLPEKLSQTLYSGWIGQGPRVEEFERSLEDYLGTERLLAVNSCTSAMHLAMHMINKGEEDEVITSPLACFASVSSILHAGLKPCWADTDVATGNMSLEDITAKLNKNTRAVLVPHFCGTPINLNRLYNILRRHYNITGKVVWVIEDCAHSFGSTYRARKIGVHHYDLELPHATSIKCFSFQSVKPLTTGDGGAIVLPTDRMYRRAKKLRWYGFKRDKDRYKQQLQEAGFKYSMNDIAATIGLHQLESMDTTIAATRYVREYYEENLSTFGVNQEHVSACPLFPVLAKDKRTKEAIIGRLANAGYEAAMPHGRLDKHPCVKDYKVNLPNLDQVCKQLYCIPAGCGVIPEYYEEMVKIILETEES